jgi:hypothetical protein
LKTIVRTPARIARARRHPKREPEHATQARHHAKSWVANDIGNAFKRSAPTRIRLAAQREFYDEVRRVQWTVARASGVTRAEFRPRTKAQLGPCYVTGYPSARVAAYAACGHTGFLELKAWTPHRALPPRLTAYTAAMLDGADPRFDADGFKHLVGLVADAVENRILVEELSRMPELRAVEVFRLFAASQQTLRFDTVAEIVDAVVLYGDVQPHWDRLALHPMTAMVLADLTKSSRPFLPVISAVAPDGLFDLGEAWVKALCKTMLPYLPPAPSVQAERPERGRERRDQFIGKTDGAEVTQPDCPQPVNLPRPPQLYHPGATKAPVRSRSLLDLLPGGPEMQKALEDLRRAALEASGRTHSWEDLRSDLLQEILRERGFRSGPLEGDVSAGHVVDVYISGKPMTGEITDRVLGLPSDPASYDALDRESHPLMLMLRKMLYPSVSDHPRVLRVRPSGSLDTQRMGLAAVTDTVFKRHDCEPVPDRRGRAVLLVATDASSSLSREEWQMSRLLTAAWLNATIGTRVHVLAGVYHSGSTDPASNHPLVQWIYHPTKSSVRRIDAARPLMSLPPHGTGCQSDALSLFFMLDEARRIARGARVYLIVISDCKWNRSFHGGPSGEDEMVEFFRQAREELRARLHTTLVRVGAWKVGAVASCVDHVVQVPSAALKDPQTVAQSISAYIAERMRGDWAKRIRQ